MDALQGMQHVLRSRPSQFPTLQNAIEWSVRSGQTKNLEAARVSMPGQLKNIETGQTSTCDINLNKPIMQSSDVQPNIESLSGIEKIDEEDEAQMEDKAFKKPPPPDPLGPCYRWRTDLFKSEPFWKGWFEGLSSLFLNCSIHAKLLLLAGIDRLDRALTIGQMQGKFQMQVLPQCGHAVHEDVPDKVAEAIATFMIRNKFTQATSDFERTFPSC